MSDFKLSSFENTGEIRSDVKAPTQMQELNAAFKECKFGRFHVRLLFISFVGAVAGVLVTNTTSYLLPTAECDLNMTLLQKGLLNAIPYLGMLVSSAIAGFLTDAFGRKLFLQIGYGGVFLFTIIAGSSQSYEVLVTAKFFEGILFATSISAHITMTSEFCHDGIRDRVMLSVSSFVAMAQIISPVMAWGILTQEWRYSFLNGYFVLNTWNFYLYAMSMWSFLACILYSTIPESPKYLLTQKKYKEVREILIKMYKENTHKSEEEYPFADLWKSKVKQASKISETSNKITFQLQIVATLHNVKIMFKKPLVIYLILLSVMCFLILGMYNVVRLWFPQLSTIVEHYTICENQDLCKMLDTYTNDLKSRSNSTESDVCIPVKSGPETYINSIIIGFVCLCPYPVTGVLVNRVGKKPLLVVAGLVTVGATMGLRWADSKTAVVALFAVVTAVSQTMKSLNQALTVEFFPTTVRTLAVSLIMMSGRIGTLFGNIAFPILLDMGCVVPFFTMAGMMMCVTAISLFLPKKK